ncbi:hypothetical protein IPJ70_02010 [Candidatus Campbellbacteria bacterium]|nr:MAG: hypothetical protein IPJ70_02010 [Candidatus Campbellbacteria bacterium]
MADKGKKPAPPPKNPTETLIGIFVMLFCVVVAINILQSKFADGGKFKPEVVVRNALFSFSSKVTQYTPLNTSVITSERTDVWGSSLRDRILGVHEKGAMGTIVSEPVLYGSDALFNVDFESSPDGWVYSTSIEKQLSGWVGQVRSVFLWVSAIVTLCGAFLAVYSWRQWRQIMKKHKDDMRALEKKLGGEDVSSHNERWERLEKLEASENPADWRVAIIEADILLDELITSMGYHGETLGEKLKAIEKSDFVTLDDAWEAHKIRNRIAHQGSDFVLTHREVKRVMSLFRNVFKEFDYI